jgi:hypothetical protein
LTHIMAFLRTNDFSTFSLKKKKKKSLLYIYIYISNYQTIHKNLKFISTLYHINQFISLFFSQNSLPNTHDHRKSLQFFLNFTLQSNKAENF